MEYELISNEQIENLPLDSELAFVEAERICRSNATRIISDDTDRSGHAQDDARLLYIDTVSQLATLFHVTELKCPDLDGLSREPEEIYRAYREFVRNSGVLATLIVARKRRGTQEDSVVVTVSTRERIQREVFVLWQIIEGSDLPGWHKAKLTAKLSELLEELSKRRTALWKVMFVLLPVAEVLGNLGGATAGIAEAPSALANIIYLLGHDKAAEEAERLRLTAPPEAHPAPRKSWGSVPTTSLIPPLPGWPVEDSLFPSGPPQPPAITYRSGISTDLLQGSSSDDDGSI